MSIGSKYPARARMEILSRIVYRSSLNTIVVSLLALTLPAFAQQPPEVQRALIELDQRSAEFAARMRGAPPAVLRDLENVTARHLVEVQGEKPPELRPYERQKAARETDAFVLRLPPPVVRVEVPEELRPRVVEPLERR